MRNGVTILGYYGANNTGDEAILQGMIEALHGQKITDITVLSRNPEQTIKLHKVKSIYTGKRFTGLIDIYQQLRRSQLFILGGGGLLQDNYSRVVPYWLSRVLIAFIARIPVIYYAHGVGPLDSTRSRFLVKLISNKVNYITLRDQPSFDLLQEVGVNRPKIEVTADPALALNIISDGRELLQNEGIDFNNGKLKIAICLRPWKDESFISALIYKLIFLKERNNIQYLFLPFQYGKDEPINQYVLDHLKDNSAIIIKGRYTPEQVAAMLSEMDGIIAMRLHALILGSISYTPSFALIYDPKVENFMQRIGLEAYSYKIEEIETHQEQLIQSLISWIDNLDNLSNQIQYPVEEMKKLTLRNAEIVKKLIDQT